MFKNEREIVTSLLVPRLGLPMHWLCLNQTTSRQWDGVAWFNFMHTMRWSCLVQYGGWIFYLGQGTFPYIYMNIWCLISHLIEEKVYHVNFVLDSTFGILDWRISISQHVNLLVQTPRPLTYSTWISPPFWISTRKIFSFQIENWEPRYDEKSDKLQF